MPNRSGFYRWDPSPATRGRYIAIAVVLVAVALATLLVLSSHVGRRDPVATLRVE